MRQNIEDKKLKDLFHQLPKQPTGMKQHFDIMRAVKEEAAQQQKRFDLFLKLAIARVCLLAIATFIILGSKGTFSWPDLSRLLPDKSNWENPLTNLGHNLNDSAPIFISITLLFLLFLYEYYLSSKRNHKKHK